MVDARVAEKATTALAQNMRWASAAALRTYGGAIDDRANHKWRIMIRRWKRRRVDKNTLPKGLQTGEREIVKHLRTKKLRRLPRNALTRVPLLGEQVSERIVCFSCRDAVQNARRLRSRLRNPGRCEVHLERARRSGP